MEGRGEMNKDDEKFYGIAKWFLYPVYVAAFTTIGHVLYLKLAAGEFAESVAYVAVMIWMLDTLVTRLQAKIRRAGDA